MTQTSLEKVNQFVLHKQHLTADSKLNKIAQVVKDLIGLHATIATTPYLSLLARTRNFQKEFLEEELYIKRTLGKIRCMRKTVHILPKEMIPIAFSATELHHCTKNFVALVIILEVLAKSEPRNKLRKFVISCLSKFHS